MVRHPRYLKKKERLAFKKLMDFIYKELVGFSNADEIDIIIVRNGNLSMELFPKLKFKPKGKAVSVG